MKQFQTQFSRTETLVLTSVCEAESKEAAELIFRQRQSGLQQSDWDEAQVVSIEERMEKVEEINLSTIEKIMELTQAGFRFQFMDGYVIIHTASNDTFKSYDTNGLIKNIYDQWLKRK